MTTINLETLKNGSVRVTAKESGSTILYLEGAASDSFEIIAKVLDDACFSHKIAENNFDMTYIEMNSAAQAVYMAVNG